MGVFEYIGVLISVIMGLGITHLATGMSKNSSLIAVSTGLLQQMTREEAEALMNHLKKIQSFKVGS